MGTVVVRPNGLSRDRLETRSAARHVDRGWYIWLGTVESSPECVSRDRHEPRSAARHLDRDWYLFSCLQSPRGSFSWLNHRDGNKDVGGTTY